MKRFHLHLAVRELERAIEFYSALFGQLPTKRRPDYAKWQLEDPPLNFALSPAANAPGVDHIGFEFESREGLEAATNQWRANKLAVSETKSTSCCYANSDKSWLYDPQGTAWEQFVTHSDSETYGAAENLQQPGKTACCGPNSATR
jgi:catechol-2,3-dioxygenase